MPWLLLLGLFLIPAPLWAGESKEGMKRQVPLLQTHARPGLVSDHLYWGMLRSEFNRYSELNQWQTLLAPRTVGQVAALSFDPNGYALYTPATALAFVQDVQLTVYFRQQRLVGILAIPKPQTLTPQELIRWVRGWLPDNAVQITYQTEGEWIVQGIIGELPTEFANDLRKSLLPFRRIVVSQGNVRP